MPASGGDFLSVFLLQSSEFTAKARKDYLIEARLTPLAPSWGFLGIPELSRRAKGETESRLATAIDQALNVRRTT
jgi:chemotaxis protein methyltransferase CheR